MRKISIDAPFQPIRNVSRLTGLSEYSLRKSVRERKIPFIYVGRDIRINYRLFLEQLEAESLQNQGA